MWNLVSSNRILDLKWKQEKQRKHLLNLQKIKPQVDTSSPKEFLFLYSRPKARQAQQLSRMLTTSSEIGKNYKNDVYPKRSLNSTYLRKVEREIDEKNQYLVNKLQNTHSEYSQRGMRRSMQQYKSVKSKMAFEKMDPFYDFETPVMNKNRRPFSAKH